MFCAGRRARSLNACFGKRSRPPPHYCSAVTSRNCAIRYRRDCSNPMEGATRHWFLAAATTLFTAAVMTPAGGRGR
jgi:hypothetical protein